MWPRKYARRRWDGTTDERVAGLRRWNVGLTVLHLAQAILMLMLAGDLRDRGHVLVPGRCSRHADPRARHALDVRLGWAVAVFLGLAAIDHW